MFGVEPAEYTHVKAWNEAEQARERVRLWYVATTRARDLLVLPRHSALPSDKCWARLVDLGTENLPALDPATGPEVSAPAAPAENAQTRVAFAEEARRIAEATPSIQWHRPSLHENDEAPSEPIPVFSDPEALLPLRIARQDIRAEPDALACVASTVAYAWFAVRRRGA